MTEKERGIFFTEEEFRNMDGVLLETNSEIMKKAGEICEILGKRDDAFSSLRKAYCLAVEALKEKDTDLQDKGEILEREAQEKQAWIDKCGALREENRTLEEEKRNLEEKLDAAGLEEESLKNRIDQLSRQEEYYQTLKAGFEQVQRECNQHYTDAKNDREEAKYELKQCRDDLAEETEKVKYLQTVLDREAGQREEKEREAERLRAELLEKDGELCALNEINQHYISQRQKMPSLMRLYEAYDAMMEKRDELPREFFECLQKVMPLDDFDHFVPAALKRSFPIACYLSIKSFIAVSGSGQVPEKEMKKALRCSDHLLEEVFAFGSAYFKEEKLFRIDMEKGDPFDDELCIYINGKGGMYGDIANVWLHGLRDEKDEKIYHSYVEGE